MADSKLILLDNAKIYVSGRKDFTWMLFNKETGYIKQMGRESSPRGSVMSDNVIDCSGKRVLPGLHESHIHLASYGLDLMNLNVSGANSIQEFKKRVSAFSKANPDRKCIIGIGWMQDKLGRYPTKEDLDEVCPDRPVILFRACIHIAVVNSMALKMAGIDEKTPNPEGGEIDHYPNEHAQAGQPTGIIREVVDSLFDDFLRPTEDNKYDAVRGAMADCLKYGVTSSHALDREGTWNVLCDLETKGEIPMRIFYVPYWENRMHQKFPDPEQSVGKLLYCDRLKIFSDGALGPCTAALSCNYKGSENNKGLLLHSQESLNEQVADVTSLGYRLEIHAIGDAAMDAVLTSLEVGQVAPERRPIIVHCQILREDLVPRMKSAGAIASIQPQFVPTDAKWLSKLLPDELQLLTYPWKTFLNQGIPCCGGSDAPVEKPHPLVGIYDAIFRPDGTDRGSVHTKCFRPEEKLSVQEAIDIYTKGGAYATLREHDLGQLLPGYQADFIVLDTKRDPIDHPEEFLSATVQQVWVAGIKRL